MTYSRITQGSRRFNLRKDDVLAEICELADIPIFHTTVGSSVPSAFFDAALKRFGLDIEGNMPIRAKRLVEFSGLKWDKSYDSSSAPSGGGGTVTTEGLDAMHQAVLILLKKQYQLGIDYRPATEVKNESTHDPFEVDPNEIDKSTVEHRIAQNLLADWLISKGIKPLSPYPNGPQFDLAWIDQEKFVVEVKSINESNEAKQIRLAIGQVLEYAFEAKAKPVIMLSKKPKSKNWEALFDFLKIKLLYPDLINRSF